MSRWFRMLLLAMLAVLSVGVGVETSTEAPQGCCCGAAHARDAGRAEHESADPSGDSDSCPCGDCDDCGDCSRCACWGAARAIVLATVFTVTMDGGAIAPVRPVVQHLVPRSHHSGVFRPPRATAPIA